MTRVIVAAMAGVVALALGSCTAGAAEQVRLLTSWYAEPEQGGFYMAKAEKLYDKAGLDVAIKMGGPQINTIQLLLAGEADFIIGYDFQILNARAKNLPVVTVATSFQTDITGILTHAGVKDLADLKGKPILIGAPSRVTFWPWLEKKFGFTDDQARPYTFNMQPFFADPSISLQGYVTYEPLIAEQHHVKANFFLLSDYGYPPYSTTIVTTDGYLKAHADTVARFVKASLEGWRDFLKNPEAGSKLIEADNPKMTDREIAYAVKTLNARHIVDGGDAETQGIGIITRARWQKTYGFMVASGILDAKTDWTAAFTDRFVKGLNIH